MVGVNRVEPERIAARRRVRLACPGREEHPLRGALPLRVHADAHPGEHGVGRVPEAVPNLGAVDVAHLEAAGVEDDGRVTPSRRGARGGVGGPEQGGAVVPGSAVEDAELAGGRERERRRRARGRVGAVGDPGDGPGLDSAVPDAEVEAGGLLGVRRVEARLEHPSRGGHQRRRHRQRLPLLQRVARGHGHGQRAAEASEEREEGRRSRHGYKPSLLVPPPARYWHLLGSY